MDSFADSDESKAREAQLVSERHDLRNQIAKLLAESEDLRLENLTLERSSCSAAVEAEQKVSQLTASHLKAQHEAALLRERIKIMHDEMDQLRQSNVRLVREVRDYYLNSGRLKNRLEAANAAMYRDVEILEEYFHAVHATLDAQISVCCKQIDVIQASCDQHIGAIEQKMDGLKVGQVCKHLTLHILCII